MVQKSYFSFTAPQKLVENNTLLADLDPNLDLTALSTIESKSQNTDESFDFSIINSTSASTSTPTPTSTPTATSSSSLLNEAIPTPTAIIAL